ncbi:MAG TPA: ribbon-helix-helix domain-containing protein [Bacteroidales bacterium]|nr:ribbon-helix-helix domain-containing protein [Bacteroidales bacterium]HNQ82556.1 ribbon-helix-helix domain-containing protein [Bacteroidales bacterium]HPI86756.1 ribbon-helix-helix domain-containing protein [Bacteroidales bacterium]HPM93204.1 ribbon-helix-helix domain-containing protein [Bacteroidales bacterium]
MKPITFTSTLPAEIWQSLEAYAEKFKVPRNRIMEQALKAYFERLKQAEYIHSFRKAAGDPEMGAMAAEGLADYLKILDEP